MGKWAKNLQKFRQGCFLKSTCKRVFFAVLLEILELFEYLKAKYSIFEVEIFLLELETLGRTQNFRSGGRSCTCRFNLTNLIGRRMNHRNPQGIHLQVGFPIRVGIV